MLLLHRPNISYWDKNKERKTKISHKSPFGLAIRLTVGFVLLQLRPKILNWAKNEKEVDQNKTPRLICEIDI